MANVLTPDGWGQLLRSEQSRGRTSYLVKGAGFEGWYDALQVTGADEEDGDRTGWEKQPDEVIPNEDNNTVLPYPDAPRGPGWDGSTSTISLKPDFHLPVEDHASDSLSGESTDEDPVKADIEGLFEPHSRLSSAPRHRLHFASSDDPILEVSRLPEESPSNTGADTEDLFDDSRPHFERESASYDRLVIEDDLSFMRFAADDDDDKKDRHDDDSDDDDDDRDDDDSGDEDSDSDDDDDSPFDDSKSDDSHDHDGGSDEGDGGSSHTASFALTTTADLHFLANFCNCTAADLPLHSKLEHRELSAEAKRKAPLGKHPLKGQHGDQKPTTKEEAGYSKKAKGIDRVLQDPEEPHAGGGQFGYKKRKVNRPLHHAEVKSPEPGRGTANGVTPQKYDLDELLEMATDDEMQQWTHQQSNLPNLVDHSRDKDNALAPYQRTLASTRTAADDEEGSGYDKYIVPVAGGFRLRRLKETPAGAPGLYGPVHPTREKALDSLKAIMAIHHSSVEKTAAPAQQPQPTQIESQIEQLMQFWACDNNGWWHWTGSQADLALLNQMQQQMAVVGMPQGQPGAMQAQSAAAGAALLEAAVPAEEGAAAEGGAGAPLAQKAPSSGTSPAGMIGGVAQALKGLNGPDGVAHHVDFDHYGFAIEQNTPARWREYLQTIASNKLMALAAWKDVVQKSKRLRSEGAIDVETFRPNVITAYVQGDNGRYYTTVQRLGSIQGMGKQNLTASQVSGWSCDCEWGHWAWLRKRSFVGRMCSHAYAVFTEMRSLDAKERKSKGKPGRFASLAKTAWVRTATGGFEWVSNDPTAPTAALYHTAAGWSAQIWSDGTSEDSLSLGTYRNSGHAQRAASRVLNAHFKIAEKGDVDVVDDVDSEDGAPESETNSYVPEPEESQTRESSFSVFAEAKDGRDDEGDEEEDDGIQEEDEPDDDESADEEADRDEDDSNSDDDGEGDGGHWEKHERDADDGDDEDDKPEHHHDEPIEKKSVAQLQQEFGLTHLAGANYTMQQQAALVGESPDQLARNRKNLNVTGTMYEGKLSNADPAAEDVLAFLF